MITSPADTLVCDTTQLAVWQSDPAYDYGRELMAPDINVFEWFNRWFGKILQKIFGSHFAEEFSELILIGSDEKRIDWQLYKTPTQYVYEVRMPAFRQLTNHFLRVRYGNFEATEALFHVMQSLQEEVKKGGAV